MQRFIEYVRAVPPSLPAPEAERLIREIDDAEARRQDALSRLDTAISTISPMLALMPDGGRAMALVRRARQEL